MPTRCQILTLIDFHIWALLGSANLPLQVCEMIGSRYFVHRRTQWQWHFGFVLVTLKKQFSILA